jgi:hypothetical protein
MTELITAVETLNRTWLERRFDDLPALFDENAIMRGPRLVEIGRGRHVIAASYAQFMAQSEVTDFSAGNYAADAWGECAAVTYDWTITYNQGGQAHTDSGQELLLFVQRDGAWVVTLRLLLF